tara:strand:- start:1767 stop:2156 length:390 start_codon:yes stop_codon:yes gene_type:complete
MGNRAVIQLESTPEVGIYLHWNGSPDMVEAFLQVAKNKGIRDDDYGVARLAQIIGNAIGGTLSMGINAIDRCDCDNGDNGLYVVRGWEVVERKHLRGIEDTPIDPDHLRKLVKEVEEYNERPLCTAPIH